MRFFLWSHFMLRKASEPEWEISQFQNDRRVSIHRRYRSTLLLALFCEASWRAPTRSATIHSLPYVLRSYAKPDMALQNRRKKFRRCIRSYQSLDTTSCVDFAKPCLASQSSWAQFAHCGLLHYWLEPFSYLEPKEKWRAPTSSATILDLPYGVKSFTTRHGFAKSTQGFSSMYSWAHRANSGLLHFWLEPFKWWNRRFLLGNLHFYKIIA